MLKWLKVYLANVSLISAQYHLPTQALQNKIINILIDQNLSDFDFALISSV